MRLQDALLAWYGAIEAVQPGSVQFGFPSSLPAVQNRDTRYSLTAFDEMIAALPRP